MAIQKTYAFEVCGKKVNFENAYCKVNKQEGTKDVVCFDVPLVVRF
jgi:hypothetical protein